jgi:hypothetical protein
VQVQCQAELPSYLRWNRCCDSCEAAVFVVCQTSQMASTQEKVPVRITIF